jgi:hypothetical protein
MPSQPLLVIYGGRYTDIRDKADDTHSDMNIILIRLCGSAVKLCGSKN